MLGFINGKEIDFSNNEMPILGKNDDLNQIYKDGWYRIGGDLPKNSPGQWAILFVKSYDAKLQFQFLIDESGIYWRTIKGDNHTIPDEWKQIAFK